MDYKRKEKMAQVLSELEQCLCRGSVKAREAFRRVADLCTKVDQQELETLLKSGKYPEITRVLEEVARGDDEESALVCSYVVQKSKKIDAENLIAKHKGRTEADAVKFLEDIEEALTDNLITQQDARAAMVAYTDKFSGKDIHEVIWGDCDSKDLCNFPNVCQIVATHLDTLGSEALDEACACESQKQAATAQIAALQQQQDTVEKRLEAAQAQVEALEQEKCKAEAEIKKAEKECEKRLRRTSKEREIHERKAKEAKKKCESDQEKLKKLQCAVEKEREALQKAIDKLKEAEECACGDCNDAMREIQLADKLKQKEKQLKEKYDCMTGKPAAKKEKQEGCEEKTERQKLLDAKAGSAITLPQATPFLLFDVRDDPDDYKAPGGVLLSTGAKATQAIRDAYDMQQVAGKFSGVAQCSQNDRLLALYHDLASQAPCPKGGEEARYNLLRQYESAFMHKEKPVNLLRVAPFDFVPWGTTQLFRDWSSAKECGGEDMWLRLKISTQNIPFDLRWYDADLYFAHAAIPRLVVIQVSNALKLAKDKADVEALQQYAYQLPPCAASQNKPCDWKQCIMQHLIDTLRPAPNDTDATTNLLQRELFADGAYLATIKTKKRKIVAFATLMLVSDALRNGTPSAYSIDRQQFLRRLIRFVELVSGVYLMVSVIPETPVVTAAQKRDRDDFKRQYAETILKRGKAFEAAMYRDFVAHNPGNEVAPRKLFLGTEALRWHLYWLSGHEECALQVDYNCLENAIVALYETVFAKNPSGSGWYVMDSQVLRNFAVVNYKALSTCSAQSQFKIDKKQLEESWTGDLLDESIASGDYDGSLCESRKCPPKKTKKQCEKKECELSFDLSQCPIRPPKVAKCPPKKDEPKKKDKCGTCPSVSEKRASAAATRASVAAAAVPVTRASAATRATSGRVAPPPSASRATSGRAAAPPVAVEAIAAAAGVSPAEIRAASAKYIEKKPAVDTKGDDAHLSKPGMKEVIYVEEVLLPEPNHDFLDEERALGIVKQYVFYTPGMQEKVGEIIRFIDGQAIAVRRGKNLNVAARETDERLGEPYGDILITYVKQTTQQEEEGDMPDEYVKAIRQSGGGLGPQQLARASAATQTRSASQINTSGLKYSGGTEPIVELLKPQTIQPVPIEPSKKPSRVAFGEIKQAPRPERSIQKEAAERESTFLQRPTKIPPPITITPPPSSTKESVVPILPASLRPETVPASSSTTTPFSWMSSSAVPLQTRYPVRITKPLDVPVPPEEEEGLFIYNERMEELARRNLTPEQQRREEKLAAARILQARAAEDEKRRALYVKQQSKKKEEEEEKRQRAISQQLEEDKRQYMLAAQRKQEEDRKQYMLAAQRKQQQAAAAAEEEEEKRRTIAPLGKQTMLTAQQRKDKEQTALAAQTALEKQASSRLASLRAERQTAPVIQEAVVTQIASELDPEAVVKTLSARDQIIYEQLPPQQQSEVIKRQSKGIVQDAIAKGEEEAEGSMLAAAEEAVRKSTETQAILERLSGKAPEVGEESSEGAESSSVDEETRRSSAVAAPASGRAVSGRAAEQALVWRRMRRLENLRETETMSNQDRLELLDLVKRWPDLQSMLRFTEEYQNIRQLEAQGADTSKAKGEMTRMLAKEDPQTLKLFFTLLANEAKQLEQCSGKVSTKLECTQMGCGYTPSGSLFACYDPEIQTPETAGYDALSDVEKEKKLIDWRRLRMLQATRSRVDGTFATRQDSDEFQALTKQNPDLKPYVERFSAAFGQVRRLRDLVALGRISGEQRDELAELQASLPPFLLVLLNGEERLLDSCQRTYGFRLTEDNCRQIGCGFSKGRLYSQCFDLETQDAKLRRTATQSLQALEKRKAAKFFAEAYDGEYIPLFDDLEEALRNGEIGAPEAVRTLTEFTGTYPHLRYFVWRTPTATYRNEWPNLTSIIVLQPKAQLDPENTDYAGGYEEELRADVNYALAVGEIDQQRADELLKFYEAEDFKRIAKRDAEIIDVNAYEGSLESLFDDLQGYITTGKITKQKATKYIVEYLRKAPDDNEAAAVLRDNEPERWEEVQKRWPDVTAILLAL